MTQRGNSQMKFESIMNWVKMKIQFQNLWLNTTEKEVYNTKWIYFFSVKLEGKSQINNQSSQFKNLGKKRKSKINPKQVEIIKSINS